MVDEGLDAIRRRINGYLQDNLPDVLAETIGEVGIRKRTGALLSSIKYLGEINPWYFSAVVEADYASYLNRGYASFDMKPGLMGKTIPIETENGLIFRKVGPNSKGWIHPGFEATHFIELAQKKLYEGILKIVENNLTELSPEVQ